MIFPIAVFCYSREQSPPPFFFFPVHAFFSCLCSWRGDSSDIMRGRRPGAHVVPPAIAEVFFWWRRRTGWRIRRKSSLAEPKIYDFHTGARLFGNRFSIKNTADASNPHSSAISFTSLQKHNIKKGRICMKILGFTICEFCPFFSVFFLVFFLRICIGT